jgi:hypothetical protein
LASATWRYAGGRWHHATIQATGSVLAVSIDGVQVLKVTDSTFASGSIGFDANAPVAFDNVTVSSHHR